MVGTQAPEDRGQLDVRTVIWRGEQVSAATCSVASEGRSAPKVGVGSLLAEVSLEARQLEGRWGAGWEGAARKPADSGSVTQPPARQALAAGPQGLVGQAWLGGSPCPRTAACGQRKPAGVLGGLTAGCTPGCSGRAVLSRSP